MICLSKFAQMDQKNQFYQKFLQDQSHFSLFSDAKLRTEDGWLFDVHQIVLARKCPFFNDLFCIFPNERDPTLIPKFRGETLNEILYFIYTDTVAFNKKNFIDIILLSDFLRIEKLYNLAKDFAKSILSAENCLQIFATSRKLNDANLRELSFRYIVTNFEKLRNEADFAEMPIEWIMEILKDNSLLVQRENIVWEFIIKWTNRDPPNRFKEVLCLLKCLKLEDIDESLANGIIQCDIVSKNPYCSELEKLAHQKFDSCLDTLKHIIYTFPDSPENCFSKIYNRRLPDCVHVIVCYTSHASLANRINFGVYITYDEELDILRKAVELEDEALEVSCIDIIGENVFVYDLRHRRAVIFNLCTNEWHEMDNLFDGFESAHLAIEVIGGNIYFISRRKVKIYNMENGLKSDAMPKYRMSKFQTVSLLNKIFVVGRKKVNGEINIVAQVYEQESNSWSFITPPSAYQSYFHLIVYHEKLYLTGGISSQGDTFISTVEVFNVARNEWERIGDLPRSGNVEGFLLSVFIFNDQLFAVFHTDDVNEQFVLNEATKTWVEPEKLLPMNEYIHTFDQNMKFHTIYDRHLLDVLVKQSRHPEAILQKIPLK